MGLLEWLSGTPDIEALQARGDVTGLTLALAPRELTTRNFAVGALERLDARAALRDPRDSVRRAVAVALGRLLHREAVEPLLAATDGAAPLLRDERARPHLEVLRSDPESNVRVLATEALRRMDAS